MPSLVDRTVPHHLGAALMAAKYRPVPPSVFGARMLWFAQSWQRVADPAAPEPNLEYLTSGFDVWDSPLQPTQGQCAVILKRSKAEVGGSPLRTPRFFDDAGFFVVQAHLFYGGACYLNAVRKEKDNERHYLALFKSTSVLRLIANTPADHMTPEAQDHYDYRRGSLPSPRHVEEVRREKGATKSPSHGRPEAIEESLRLWDKNHGKTDIPLDREGYHQLLLGAYQLLDRMYPATRSRRGE